MFMLAKMGNLLLLLTLLCLQLNFYDLLRILDLQTCCPADTVAKVRNLLMLLTLL
jgi:hypothetical protein